MTSTIIYSMVCEDKEGEEEGREDDQMMTPGPIMAMDTLLLLIASR